MVESTASFWHDRFLQQAQWTQSLRHYLYRRADLAGAGRVLEVGCGTGAILTELLMQSHGQIYGVDISTPHLDLAARHLPGIFLNCGDAHDLPYPCATFDITLCHFLILWVHDPVKVLKEMGRVTRPGGVVIALAEPDYGGRIDYPSELQILGDWQQTALRQQGADPLIGRRLRALFQQASFIEIEAGLLGGQWSGRPSPEDWEMEWKVLAEDIKITSDPSGTSEINKWQKLDLQAWEQGERILFVPTFYTWGRVPAARNSLITSTSK